MAKNIHNSEDLNLLRDAGYNFMSRINSLAMDRCTVADTNAVHDLVQMERQIHRMLTTIERRFFAN